MYLRKAFILHRRGNVLTNTASITDTAAIQAIFHKNKFIFHVWKTLQFAFD